MPNNRCTELFMSSETILTEKDSFLLLINYKLDNIDADLQNPRHYINNLLSQSAPKKSFYVTWAELLEDKYNITNQHEEISSIANTMRKKLISLNKQSQIVWMYESLPSKYKLHKLNPADVYGEQTNNSSPHINYELENKPYIDMIDNTIQALYTIKKKLETTEFLTKKDKHNNYLLDPKRIQTDITILNAANDLLLDVWDNRKAVSIYTQHFLISMVLRFNIGHATGAYLGFIKDFGAKAMKKSTTILDNLLSSKQVGKIMRGLTKDLHKRYDPKNKDEAQLMGFWGDQCMCDSWRATYETIYDEANKKLERKCKCHGCNETWIPTLELLPSAKPSIIIDAEGTV